MRIDPWITNGTGIEEEVLVPFKTVIWHVAGWDGENPIVYGDEHGMFIFDPSGKKFHSLLYESYVVHDITRIEQGGAHNNAAFLVELTGIFDLTHQKHLTDAQWEQITMLIESCSHARRWLMMKRAI